MRISTGGPNGSACLEGETCEIPDGLALAWVAQGRAAPADGVPIIDAGVMVINGDPLVQTQAVKKLKGR